jgi:hypothetical protein
MVDSESSTDTTDYELFLNLRTRKVLMSETDPAKRCTVVPSWPKRATMEKMKQYCERSAVPPAETVCSGFCDAPLSMANALRCSMQ